MAFAEQIPSTYIKACVLAYLSTIDIREGKEAGIKNNVGELLELMSEAGYDYFWGWDGNAAEQAGRMRQPLRMWVLWPRPM